MTDAQHECDGLKSTVQELEQRLERVSSENEADSCKKKELLEHKDGKIEQLTSELSARNE